MPLTFAERKKARGMLADKQGIGSIAEELECSNAEIQALADAKPKPVRLAACLRGCSARTRCCHRAAAPRRAPSTA